MLRAEDNKFLTESDAGTPMGELLRRFWLPVLLSEELPERRRPAEEDHRHGRGTAGLPRHPRRGRRHRPVLPAPRRQSLARPQRGVRHPLRLPRLEVRHRRAAASTCRPPIPTSTPRTRSASRPIRRASGATWSGPTWGRRSGCRSCPTLEMALVPASHRYVSKKWQDCNWVQALEGSIDTAHFTFAHLTFEKDEDEDPRHQEAFRQSAGRGSRPITCAGSPTIRAPSSRSIRTMPG